MKTAFPVSHPKEAGKTEGPPDWQKFACTDPEEKAEIRRIAQVIAEEFEQVETEDLAPQ